MFEIAKVTTHFVYGNWRRDPTPEARDLLWLCRAERREVMDQSILSPCVPPPVATSSLTTRHMNGLSIPNCEVTQ
ncbi:MAG: hypothetical protein QOC81_996 [Thermoanaerobaculia bacterium]|jgi:hypothetical protein|nr:hypothetical protein [Thermoanaerobaculia bacterium]